MSYKDANERAAYQHEYYLEHSTVKVRNTGRVTVGNALTTGTQRMRAYEVLGHCCARCGECDPMVLEFNHTNGGGKEHRLALGEERSHGSNFVRWVLDNPEEAREQVELLCANCHAREHSLFNRVEGYQQHRY